MKRSNVLLAMFAKLLLVFASTVPVTSVTRALRPRTTQKSIDIPLQVTKLYTPIDSGLKTYAVNITLGTPPTSFQLWLNFGWGDTTFSSTQFNCSLSSTCLGANIALSSWLDSDGIRGQLLLDTISIPVANITTELEIGQLNLTGEVFFFQPYLGLGLPVNEGAGSQNLYPNFVQTFVNTGAILLNAVSIWSDSIDESSGHLVLGGISADIIQSQVAVLNATVLPEGGSNGFQPFVPVTGISIVSPSGTTAIIGTSPLNITAALFPGANDGSLPGQALQSLLTAMGVNYTYNASDPASINREPFINVPCSFGTNTTLIAFTLGPNFTVQAPLSELIQIEPTGSNSSLCVFQLFPNGELGNIMEIPRQFTRRLYTVFDYTNMQITVAHNSFNTTSASGNTILEIPAGGMSQLLQSQQSTAVPANPNHSKKLGIGLGVGLGVPFITAIALLLCLGRSKLFKSKSKEAAVSELHGAANDLKVGEMEGNFEQKAELEAMHGRSEVENVDGIKKPENGIEEEVVYHEMPANNERKIRRKPVQIAGNKLAVVD
ncbi:hypothetical protein G7Y89_g9787 [Cudoniella acicularis]|uniref:Peptidase A1 domain-containing protein n=1 Tax=Cudoniella acicularis TaxID=354080 RepID=A0A8H4W289_9HELO|nr:hypothetical protein G7Y89_g9787 [Cudoniella acicularis]